MQFFNYMIDLTNLTAFYWMWNQVLPKFLLLLPKGD